MPSLTQVLFRPGFDRLPRSPALLACLMGGLFASPCLAEDAAEERPSRAVVVPEVETDATAESEPLVVRGARGAGRELWGFGRDTLGDAVRIVTSPVRWRTKEWLAVGAVGAATGALVAVDGDVRDAAQSNEGFRAFGDAMHDVSNGPLPFGILGGFALSGALLDRPKDLSTARLAIESTIITGVLVTGLKHALGRARPREELGPTDFEPFGGNHAMPSGEVAVAFAIAQVVAERYESWPVRILAYGIATTVAAGRIGDDAHWASDVFLGAASGIAISHAILRYDERRQKKKDLELVVMPRGFRLTYTF